MRIKLVGSIIAIVMFAGMGTAYAKNTDNDVSLRGDRGEFIEYFKQDKKGADKNYLYTVSEQDAPALGKCDVYTIASESYIQVVCNMGTSR